MEITTLVENSITTGLAPLMGERGLSFFIETKGRKILFDTGKGLTLLSNANALGNKPENNRYRCAKPWSLRSCMGGVKYLVKRNNSFTVIAHPQIFENKLVLRDNKYHSIVIFSLTY